MAPRPVLVSGGTEDPPRNWQALNHLVAVNDLLGHKHRVAMTARKGTHPDARGAGAGAGVPGVLAEGTRYALSLERQ